MTGFYTNCDTGIKWVKKILQWLAFLAPTPQNRQTHSNNSSENCRRITWVWPFCGAVVYMVRLEVYSSFHNWDKNLGLNPKTLIFKKLWKKSMSANNNFKKTSFCTIFVAKSFKLSDSILEYFHELGNNLLCSRHLPAQS